MSVVTALLFRVTGGGALGLGWAPRHGEWQTSSDTSSKYSEQGALDGNID